MGYLLISNTILEILRLEAQNYLSLIILVWVVD